MAALLLTVDWQSQEAQASLSEDGKFQIILKGSQWAKLNMSNPHIYLTAKL